MQMINHARVLCWAVTVGALALGARAAEEPKPDEPAKAARQQLRPERLVSDASLLYVATPDFRKARSAFERTAFQALLREDEVGQPLLEAFGKLRDAYVKGDGTRGETEMRRRNNEVELLMRLAPLLEGQVALAVEGDASGLLSSGALPRFLLAASMPADEDGERWQRTLQGILEKHRAGQGMDPRYKDREERLGNYDVVRLENAEAGGVEAWAFVENLFLYGQGKRVVEDAIERYSVKNGAGTLSLHNGYLDAYKQAGRDERSEALVYLQADIRPWLNSYPELQKALDPKVAALEANRPHLAMGMYVGEGENAAIKEKILLRLSKDALPRGGGACEGVTARFAQNDTLFYTAMQGNLAEMYKEGKLAAVCKWIVNRFKEAPAEGGAEKEDLLGERLKLACGAQNEAELLSKLELFKGEFGVFLAYVPQPNLRMETLQDYLEVLQPIFVLELDRDNAVADTAVRALLVNIQNATGQQYLPTTSAGVQIFYQKGAAPREETTSSTALGLFRNLAEPPPDSKVTPFFVAHARMDIEMDGGRQRKFLLLSETLHAIKTATRQAQAKFSRSSLAEDKKLKDLTRSFRESRNVVSYLDLTRLTNVYADQVPRLARAGTLRRELVEQLPSANVLRDHVSPMAWACSVVPDPDGLLIECSSPMGNLPMVGVIGAVAWPAIVEKQQESVSEEVDDRFRHLMLALHLYAANFNHFPQQLSDLFPTYVKSETGLRLFESPFKRGAVKSGQDADIPDSTNLVYVPDRSLQGLGSDILIFEKEPTKVIKTRDGPKIFHHVLTLDGKKTWMTKAALERALTGKAELPGTGVTEPAKSPKK